MENSRTILAVALSILVLLSWSIINSKMQPVENKEVIEKKPAETIPLASLAQPVLENKSEEPDHIIELSRQDHTLVFSESKAAIQEVRFAKYQDYSFILKQSFSLAGQNLVFKKIASSENSITFAAHDTDKKISKQFVFSKDLYYLELELIVQNLSNQPIAPDNIIVANLDFKQDKDQGRFQDIVLGLENRILHNTARKNTFFEQVKFLAWRNRYFCGIIEPEDKDFKVSVTTLNNHESVIGLVPKDALILPGQQVGQRFRIYLGPQDPLLIGKINKNWLAVIHYGTFDFISRILIQILNFIYNLLHNWGLAIILLSAFVYIILYPFTIKQMNSMKRMQELQPQLEELRQLYKDNPHRFQKEQMELFKKHKINPASGCLIFFLQIPVFFALYQALIRTIALKGARFLWIKDLSEPDRLFMLPISFKIPIFGVGINAINILPIAMTLAMFLQQKTSLAKTTGEAAQQQKLLLIIMPIMFGLIFYNMPSGLVLYWLVNTLLTLTFQLKSKFS